MKRRIKYGIKKKLGFVYADSVVHWGPGTSPSNKDGLDEFMLVSSKGLRGCLSFLCPLRIKVLQLFTIAKTCCQSEEDVVTQRRY